jgi:acetyl esterase
MSDPFARPDVQVFLDALKANPRPKMTAENIAAMRPLAPQGMAMLEPPIGELALMRDAVMPGPGGEIPLRLFDSRAEREAGPAVVFFHGGGFVIGNIDTHAPMCAEIARRLDLPVISVDYRLAPEHPWPAAPDDAEAASRWIADNGAVFGRVITGLVLCGDSAGGNLSIVTALALRDRPVSVPVITLIALYPSTDRTRHYASSDAFGEGFGLDNSDIKFYMDSLKPQPGHWRASPLLADQTSMPAALIVTAALDPLRDQGRAYAAALIAAGVPTTYREFTGTIHGFLGFRRVIPSAQSDMATVLQIAGAMIRESQGAP